MRFRLLVLTVVTFGRFSSASAHQAQDTKAADRIQRMESAYRDEAIPEKRTAACKIYSEVATDNDTDVELRANALQHYADLFKDCRPVASLPYESEIKVYEEIIKVGTDEQKALAANNIAATLVDNNLDAAIRAMASIPFSGKLSRASRVTYRVNLAHLYIRAKRLPQAFQAYRDALSAGANPDLIKAEMADVIPALSKDPAWGVTWPRLVVDAGRAFGENGSPAEGAELLRTALNQELNPAQRELLISGLLQTYSTLPIDREDFTKNQSPWLAKSQDARLRALAATMDDKLGIWLTDDVPQNLAALIGTPTGKVKYLETLGQSQTLRLDYSQFLMRVADTYVVSDSIDNDTQALARYLLAWRVSSDNIAAALRTAAAVSSIDDKALEPQAQGIRKLLQVTYDPSKIDAAYLTSSDLSNLFELYTYMARFPGADREMLEDALDIRKQLRRRDIATPPIPLLLSVFAEAESRNNPKDAAKLYLEAAHDFDRIGAMDRAEQSLRLALGLRPGMDVYRLRLSEGQLGLTAFIGAQESVDKHGNPSVEVELRGNESPIRLTSDDEVKLSSDLNAFRIRFPRPLTGGTSVQVNERFPIGASRLITVRKQGIVPSRNRPSKTIVFSPSEGDKVIQGLAQIGIRTVRIEIARPKGACGRVDPLLPETSPIIQIATARVDPESGEFKVGLRRSLLSGEIITVYDVLRSDATSVGATAEVSNSRLNEGPLRLYTQLGVEFFNPQGKNNSFVSPQGALTADATLFGSSLRIPYPLCDDRAGAANAITLNLFAESRIETITALRSDTTPLEQLTASHVMEGGFYIPYAAKSWRYQSEGRDFALFLAPILKVGGQARQTSTNGYWATGMRLGSWRLARSDAKSAPILKSYGDLTVGRWNTVLRDSPKGRPPLRYELNIQGKVLDALPYTFGLRLNFGPGPNDYRFHVSLRYELSDLIHRAKREGILALLR